MTGALANSTLLPPNGTLLPPNGTESPNANWAIIPLAVLLYLAYLFLYLFLKYIGVINERRENIEFNYRVADARLRALEGGEELD